MSGTCDGCLRRGYLVGLLSGRIAGMLGRPHAPGGLLALADHELAASMGASGREEALAFLGRFEPRRARADLRARAVDAVCRHHAGYPALLGDLADPPAVLFSRGRRELLAELDEQPAVTVVGTRDATPYGLDVARGLGRGLGAAGLTTISGMAIGVDGAAHRGALGAGGATIAVLACGPDYAYPRRHRELLGEIAASGLVISELPPGQRPYRWSFPARNRLMAALARLTVVVEAGESSGTLITADFASQLGRTVGAVPGRVSTRAASGANRLLRDGAAVIRDAADVLDEVFGAGTASAARRGAARPAEEDQGPELEPVERKLLDAVEAGLDIDAICAFAAVPVEDGRAALARLELRGLVRREGLLGWERVTPMLRSR